VLRAARVLGFTALGLLAATLAVLTIAGVLMTDLFSDGVGVDVDSQFWSAVVFTGVVGTLCLADLTALVVALRGRRLLAQYRQERDDWREVRAAQGSLLRRR
jgi:hypothetical protein